MDDSNNLPTRVPSGAMVRQQFDGLTTTTGAELQAATLAAQAKAAVEAHWIVALRNPRHLDTVRHDLLEECKRRSFAEVARYRKPIGKGFVEGPSIRFVEQAMQAMGNMDSDTVTVYDDDQKRVVKVIVIDYERNVRHTREVTITKRVERSRLREGQTALATRTNSYGRVVYLVEASDDELATKEAALVSKALRTCGLRLIPGWLVEECMGQAITTMESRDQRDPDAEKRRVADAFATLHITPGDLEEYLGHDLGKVTPGELKELRAMYTAIRAEETTWHEVMESRREERGDSDSDTKPDAQPSRGTKAVKDKLRRRAEPKPAPTTPRRGGPDDSDVRFTEWVFQDGRWRGEWEIPDSNSFGAVLCYERGEIDVYTGDKPTDAVRHATTWAFAKEPGNA